MTKLYQLNQTLTFNRPQTWEIHPRYVFIKLNQQQMSEKD